MTFILGIDPGLKGGYALMVFGRKDASASPFPIAGKELDLAHLALDWACLPKGEGVAVVEQVHAMPKQGVSSCFTFGKGYGSILGVLAALRIPYELVTPQAWKKVVLSGTQLKDKNAAIAYCRRVFPNTPLIRAGCRVPHDGMADALCIAEYGRRTFFNHRETT